MNFTPLSQEQHRQFNDEGYIIVRNALDAETVAKLVEAGDRLCNSELTENRQSRSERLYDGFRNCVAMDEAFMSLLTLPTTVPLVVQLLGPHIQLVTSHLIYKGSDPDGTLPNYRDPGWHRDIAGTPEDLGHAHIPRMEMKVAYYLTDLSEPNTGVTMFSPGSNHLKHPIHIAAGSTDPESVIEPLLNPGDAVFFENRTYHAGAANLSGRTRKAVMFGYGYQWLAPFDYRIQPDSLTKELCPIGQQLLGALKDPQGHFIPGGIDTPLRDWCATHGVFYDPPA